MEFEGEDLEELKELENLDAPLPYDQIMETKSKTNWKKAERNRALGYTSTSQRIRQCKEKGARDRVAFRNNAKISCAHIIVQY
jgi:hypothetical protein